MLGLLASAISRVSTRIAAQTASLPRMAEAARRIKKFLSRRISRHAIQFRRMSSELDDFADARAARYKDARFRRDDDIAALSGRGARVKFTALVNIMIFRGRSLGQVAGLTLRRAGRLRA